MRSQRRSPARGWWGQPGCQKYKGGFAGCCWHPGAPSRLQGAPPSKSVLSDPRPCSLSSKKSSWLPPGPLKPANGPSGAPICHGGRVLNDYLGDEQTLAKWDSWLSGNEQPQQEKKGRCSLGESQGSLKVCQSGHMWWRPRACPGSPLEARRGING